MLQNRQVIPLPGDGVEEISRQGQRFAVVFASFLVTAGLVGCGQSADRAAEPAPVATPTPTSMAQLRFPLDAYAPSVAQKAQEDKLASHLINLCVQRYGFPPLSSTNLSASIDQSIRVRQYTQTRRYGLSDRKVAEQYGYGMPAWSRGTAAPLSIDDVPPEELLVLRGSRQSSQEVQHQGRNIPPGGCWGEAVKIVGTPGGGPNLAEKLQAGIFQRMKTESKAQAVLGRWSQCMKSKGYKYSDPWNAGNGFGAEDGESGPPSSAEVKSAVASVDCSYAVNLPGVLFAVESDLQNIEIEKNAEALEDIKDKLDARARHVQSLVRKYGG